MLNRCIVSLVSAVAAALASTQSSVAANTWTSTWTQTYSNTQTISNIDSSLTILTTTATTTYNGDTTQTQTVTVTGPRQASMQADVVIETIQPCTTTVGSALSAAASASIIQGYGRVTVNNHTYTQTYNGQRTQTHTATLANAAGTISTGPSTLNAECADAPRYTTVELTGLTHAAAINELGDVAGQIGPATTGNGQYRAAIWEDGQVIDLGVAGCRGFVIWCGSTALGLNNQGVAVGESNIANGSLAPFYNFWAGMYKHETVFGHDGPRPLKTIGWYGGVAEDISNNGTVVGYTLSSDAAVAHADYLQHGFVMDKEMIWGIGEFGQTSSALAVNEHNVVTGAIDVDGHMRAYRWRDGVVTVLDHLGGMTSRGKDIANSQNQIVGEATTTEGHLRAVTWHQDALIDLGTLPEDTTSTANALNERGDIVGTSGARAALWRNQRVYDLNALVDAARMRLVEAIDINNHGEIVAKGSDGKFYVLKPLRGTNGTPSARPNAID